MVTSPLIIKTTAEMGFQVPVGLVVQELRTSPDQSLVIEHGADEAFLDVEVFLNSEFLDSLAMKLFNYSFVGINVFV